MINTRNVACIVASAFIGTLLIGAAAFPVHAQTSARPVTVIAQRPDTLTRVVPYGDLSLASKAGRNVLYRRVGLAVHQVCPDTDEFAMPLDVNACETFAWRGARPQIRQAVRDALNGAPMLTAIEISSSLGR